MALFCIFADLFYVWLNSRSQLDSPHCVHIPWVITASSQPFQTQHSLFVMLPLFSPSDSVLKNLPAKRRPEFNPWVRKIPWRGEWQLIPVFLPGQSHGQGSLEGCSPWGHRVGHDWVPKQQVSFHQVKFINNMYIISNLSMYCPTFSKEEIKVFYATNTLLGLGV